MNDNSNLAGRVLEEERLLGVTEISNTLAHKLNQYLQVIMGYISLMTLEMNPEHQCYDYLNRILEQLENIRVTTYMLSNINRYAIIQRPDGRRMFDLGPGCRGTCNIILNTIIRAQQGAPLSLSSLWSRHSLP